MHARQMQEAEARLSEVIKCAESEGPQNITLHGQIVAVMVSKSMFERLTGKGKTSDWAIFDSARP